MNLFMSVKLNTEYKPRNIAKQSVSSLGEFFSSVKIICNIISKDGSFLCVPKKGDTCCIPYFLFGIFSILTLS